MRVSSFARLFLLPSSIISFVVFPDAPVFLESLQRPEQLASEAQSHTPDKQGSPISHPSADDTSSEPLPVLIWHGLGDSADAKGLKEVAELIDDIHPGTYVQIISLGNHAGAPDRSQSFFGNVTEQIDKVCHDLAHDNILMTAPAVDAIGFSQGGQFLRGMIERCGDGKNGPKVRSLITWGSQHNGIQEFQKCESATDWVCQGANALLKGSTVWSSFVQSRLVPAQYYRPEPQTDEDQWEKYLEHSNFLADINNERKTKNSTYAENLASVSKLVMIYFKEDKTVIPKESGWFSEVQIIDDGEKQIRNITKLQDRQIYNEDWIGLKKLDKKGALVFEEVEGGHMQLSDKDLKRLFGKYLGPEKKTDESWREEL
jgi:palmitoyl-protein thioesterase